MIRILIADDHAIVRAGLQTLLSGLPDMEVAGEASSGTEAIRMVREGKWDVVLLDISMPDKNGVDTLTEIKRHRPELPVVMLSMHPESQYAVSLLRAGASGYVSKEGAPEELVVAIRTVAQGRRYVSATLGELLAADLDRTADRSLHGGLSEREFQIFCKLATGQPVSRIAEELFLSVKTVSTYRARILEKMGMKTNADLTYYAIKNGLIE
ncbi:MAG: response regulator transcription factor [Burkholderiales bacterium]|nr:response regulator transcription factor [Burkholderiales bacterium]